MMRSVCSWLSGIYAVCAVSIGIEAALGAAPPRDPTAALLQKHPDLIVQRDGPRVIALSGRMMAQAPTAQAAAERWIRDHAPSLGVSGEQLHQTGVARVGQGNLLVFTFQQSLDGLPVENGVVKLGVLEGAGAAGVVHAAGKLAQGDASGIEPYRVSAEDALRAVRDAAAYSHLTEWSEPTQVVFTGEDDGWVQPQHPRRAWKFTGAAREATSPAAFTFFADGATGALLHARSEVYEADLHGRLTAYATPGTRPDTASNPPVEVPLPGASVIVVGGQSVQTTGDGTFVIPNVSSFPVTVRAELKGPWAVAQTIQGGNLRVEKKAIDGNPLLLVANQEPSEFTTAQVNAFLHASATHDFYKQRQPDYFGLDFPVTVNANFNSTCNAFFSSTFLSIHLFNSGSGCANTAYSSIITHEYGHFILHTLGVAQGAFGEGFSDALAILMYEDPVIGRDIRGPGTYIRDIANAGVRYPCGDTIHYCGQALAGLWWDIRRELQRTLGDDAGLELARQMFTDWSQITIGGLGSNAIHAVTAVEIALVDDDDGDLSNGTPHEDQLCVAFSSRNIGCPQPPKLAFAYPESRPSIVPPDAPTQLRVVVRAGTSTPVPGTGFVHYRTSGSSFTSKAMQGISAEEYLATFPAVSCRGVLDYYFSVLDLSGIRLFDPPDAPHQYYSAVAASHRQVLLRTQFESPADWTVGDPGDLATEGIWERVVPVGSASQPAFDHTPDPGAACFVTGQGVPGARPQDHDVDNGATTLLSPPIKLWGEDAFVSYWRWFSNHMGDGRFEDVFKVDITGDGGLTWVNVETVGPTGPEVTGTWIHHEFRVGAFMTPPEEIRVRFVAADAGVPSIVEAALDDFEVYRYACGIVHDCNGNLRPDETDIAEGFSSDCNGNGVPDDCDIRFGTADDFNGNGVIDSCECNMLACDDGERCTLDTCDPDTGACIHIEVDLPYGDLTSDGIVDVDDVLCVIVGFVNTGACPQADVAPCEGSGAIDMDDILAVLGALAGHPRCPGPCD